MGILDLISGTSTQPQQTKPPTGVPSFFGNTMQGGGLFDSPVMSILMPHTYDRMQATKDRALMMQQREFELQQLKQKYEVANQLADRIQGTNPAAAMALRADPSLMDNILNQQFQEGQQKKLFGHEDTTAAAQRAFDLQKQNALFGHEDTASAAQRAFDLQKQNALFGHEDTTTKNQQTFELFKQNQLPPAVKQYQDIQTNLVRNNPVIPGTTANAQVAGPRPMGMPQRGDVLTSDQVTPDVVRATEAAQSGMPNLSTNDAIRMMTDPNAMRDIQYSQSIKPENAYAQSMAKFYSDQSQQYQKDMFDAGKSTTGLNYMEKQLKDGAYTGWQAPLVQQGKQLLAAIGGDPNAASSLEGFNAEAGRQMLELANGRLSTGVSDEDRKALTAQVPNITNTPAGNLKIIEYMRAINARKIDIGKQAIAYEAEHGKLDAGFTKQISEYADAHPMFTSSDTSTTQTPTSKQAPSLPKEASSQGISAKVWAAHPEYWDLFK